MLASAITPLAGIAHSGSLAFYLAGLIGSPFLPSTVWLFLPAIFGIALAAAVDVLVQCRTHRLLAGKVPGLTFLTVLLGSLVLDYALYRLAGRLLRNMR